MTILDGEKLSKKILSDLKIRIEEKKLRLKIAVVLVGDSDVSKSYITKKREACEKIGIEFYLLDFPADISQEDIEKEITKLAADNSVSGIVVQLPIPKHLNTTEVLNLIPKEKDIDILSETAGKEFSAGNLIIFPPVVGAIKLLFEEYNISLENKKIVVIGKGRLVGKPIAAWLSNQKCDFEVLDRNTEDIASVTKEADIIISGAGTPSLITNEMVKDGAVLIDAGTSSEDGKVVGDIDKSAYEKASFVSPVPGGVGPMTIACLVKNVVSLN